jgi:hypothetical protein
MDAGDAISISFEDGGNSREPGEPLLPSLVSWFPSFTAGRARMVVSKVGFRLFTHAKHAAEIYISFPTHPPRVSLISIFTVSTIDDNDVDDGVLESF